MRNPTSGIDPASESTTGSTSQRDRAPAWNVLAIVILVTGLTMVAVGSVTVCYAGLTGAFACLVCGCACVLLARRSRFWN